MTRYDEIRERLKATRTVKAPEPVQEKKIPFTLKDRAGLIATLEKCVEVAHNAGRFPDAHGMAFICEEAEKGFAVTYGALDKAITGMDTPSPRVRVAVALLKRLEKSNLEALCALVLSANGSYGRGVDDQARIRYHGYLTSWGLKPRVKEEREERKAEDTEFLDI